MKNIILIFILLFPSSAIGKDESLKNKWNSFRENTKEKVENVKEKWDEREHVCPRCGKKTHLKGLCASCKARDAKEKARKTGRKGKEIYGKTKDVTRETYRKAKPKVTAAIKKADEIKDKSADFLREKYPEVKRVVGKSIDNIRSPETREKAMKIATSAWVAANKLAEFKREIRRIQKASTYEVLDSLSNLKLSGPDGEITFGELMSQVVVHECPGIEGTGIEEDPLACAAAVICTDRSYFYREVKVFSSKDGKSKISAAEVVDEASPFDSDEIVKSLEILEASDDLGESLLEEGDVVGSIVNFARVVDAARK